MESTKLNECVEVLKSKKWTIAFAEGASEGKICYEFAELPAADSILLGGMVAMKDHMKDYFFGIKPELLQKYGSESPEVAKLMADHLCKYLKADISVSVTVNECSEVTTPNPHAFQVVNIHIIFPHSYLTEKYELQGTKQQVAEQTVVIISNLITNELMAMA
jgi:nicotinamide-nucleotide amidase